MADAGYPPYEELPTAVQERLDQLRRHSDPEVRNDAVRVQMWTEEFNRIGVHRLVELVLAWRGEIFLESALRDEVTATFLARYGIAEPS